MNLEGTIAVITGAARGIGKAIAKAFVDQGARVAVADVLAEPLAQTAAELGAGGATVLAVEADVTQAEQVESLADRVERALGPADVLVNNAGTFSYIGPVWEADPARWFRDTQVNLLGSFLCCRAFVRRMVQRGQGRVINMVSAGGVGDPHPHCTSYAVSKAALMRLTEGLAAEAGPLGVKVFALAPPAVDTAMTRFILEDPGGQKYRPNFGELFTEHKDRPPEVIADWCVRIALGQADALAGRFLPAGQDFDTVLGLTDRILADDLLTLRIRYPKW